MMNNDIIKNFASFSFKCPHCLKIITSQDFSEEQMIVAHLQDYFLSQENQYKEKLFEEMKQNIESIPLVINLREENNTLKSFVEGYKLAKEFVKPTQKGQEFESYVYEELQKVFSIDDIIENITHSHTLTGARADILQTIRAGSERDIGKIIYEVKNTSKWENSWPEKLESDMKSYQADFGIIIATCYKQPLTKPHPRKNIFFTNSENFIFAGQIARLLTIQKNKLKTNDDLATKDQRIDNLEKWIREKMPNYIEDFQKYLNKWEKEINNIMSSARKMVEFRDYIKKTIFDQMFFSLNKL